MTSSDTIRLEEALVAAQRALRALEAMVSHEETASGAHAVRRAIGAMLDAIDGREAFGSSMGRARAAASLALAVVAGGAPDVEEAALAVEERDALDALQRALAALPAASEAGRPSSAARPPDRGIDRAVPPWRISEDEPGLFDVPRNTLLPLGAVVAPLPPTPFDVEAWAEHTEALVAALQGGGDAPPAPLHSGRQEHSGLQEDSLRAAASDLEARVAQINRQLPDTPSTPRREAAREDDDAAIGRVLAPSTDPGGALPAPAVPSAEQLRQRHVRQLFEELGMCGWQRRPLLGDDWRDLIALEQRLLALGDAVVGYGAPALAALEPWARDAPAPEPMRVYAAAFVAGIAAGRDALAAAERVLFAHDPHDPDIVEAFVDALVATPNPDNDKALRALLRAPSAVLRAGAVTGLARREALTFDEADVAAADEPAVAAAASTFLATSIHPYARERLDQLVARQGETPSLDRALWYALSLAHHPDAAVHPRAALDHSDLAPDAAMALALVADREDARTLIERARAKPSAARYLSLGWAGHPEAIPMLIDALEEPEEAVSTAAAWALYRLVGAEGPD
ncbi:MAG: hypothetical protein AAGN82_09495, partial [Myxococcota bacterium]